MFRGDVTMKEKSSTKPTLLILGFLVILVMALSACAPVEPQVIVETQIVEVEKEVKVVETVEVEKEITVIETVEVMAELPSEFSSAGTGRDGSLG
jgi:hypothetical protein